MYITLSLNTSLSEGSLFISQSVHEIHDSLLSQLRMLGFYKLRFQIAIRWDNTPW